MMKSLSYTRTALLLLCLSLPAVSSAAAPGNRTGQWQISLIPSYTNSQTVTFEGGATADISSHSGFAIGIGYNFSDYLELDFDIGSANGNYTGTRILDDGNNTQERYNGSMYTSHINLGLTYNFLASRLTPFVKGNLGLTYVDSGIPTGNIGSVCWWDPWWGYFCGPYAQTYTASELSYGADLGLRFDVTRAVFLKGSVGKSYINFDKSSSTGFTVYKFIIGFSFK
jgi:opacity protein-like surface antigen